MSRSPHNSHRQPRLQVQQRGDATVATFLDRSLVDEPVVSTVGRELLSLVAQESIQQLIVNFGNVESFTSKTLSHLLTCQKVLSERGGTLVLCNPSAHVREILDATKLAPLFDIRADAAVQTMPSPGLPDVSAGLTHSPGKPAFGEVAVALCDFDLERARLLFEGCVGDWSVMHLTDLDTLTRYCENHAPAVVALPLAWPAEGRDAAYTDTAVLRFIRSFGRQRSVCVYTERDNLSIEVYSRILAAGARQVINEGAPRFLEEFRRTVDRLATDHITRAREEEQLTRAMAEHGMVGASAGLREVFRRMLRAAQFSDVPVLVLGETGTGKQLVAEGIHRLDPRRRDKPFLTVNCSTLSKALADSELFGHSKGAFSGADNHRLGWFRAVDGGVLFLDEIGELPLDLQPKLLRVLQNRRLLPVGSDYEHDVNVRVIAATNRELVRMVADGLFRRDLYQRLHVFQIEIPPLRERPEDIAAQAGYFLRRCQPALEPAVHGFGPRVLEALALLPLEGNTRQLENLIRHAVAHKDSGSLLEMEDLPRWAVEALARRVPPSAAVGLLDSLVHEVCHGRCTLAEAIAQLECRLLQKILHETGGNRTRTAGVLGLTPRSIFNKIKKYRLDVPDVP